MKRVRKRARDSIMSSNETQFDGGVQEESQIGKVAEVAGHQVTQPDKMCGMNVSQAKRKESGGRNPYERVIRRDIGRTYQVGANLLVTITGTRRAPTWDEACAVRGGTLARNNPGDVIVDAVLSPMTRHAALPHPDEYNAEDDTVGITVTVRASRLLDLGENWYHY